MYSTSTDFIPIAIKIVLVEIVLVETVLVGDPLYLGEIFLYLNQILDKLNDKNFLWFLDEIW